ncbi:MAG: GFA family protein [Rudaea sp.]
MLIRGRCHCGNIAFTLDWTPDPPEIPARACTCSFCTKHGGVWTSHPAASLEIAIADPDRVSGYAFGTRTATFHVCATCGVVPVVTSVVDDHVYAVVSVNAFENVDHSRLQRTPASFETEDEDARLARRKRNWIASVSFVEPGA